MLPLKLNTSFQLHLIIAIMISVWLVVFLVLIAPFDAGDLSFMIRLQILPPYGLISLISYLAIVPLQNFVFKKSKKWTVFLEVLIIVVYNLLVWLGSYMYYKTDIINGLYSFSKFTLEVYYPIFFILLPIIVFGRWYLTKRVENQPNKELVLIGENKYDILKINSCDLLCISSADNYVEVSYLLNNELQKKLLRNTLKNIHTQKPDLLKVHRSHIINPLHFKEWINSNTIQLSHMQVPISKNYKKDIVAILDSPLKTMSLSQTQ